MSANVHAGQAGQSSNNQGDRMSKGKQRQALALSARHTSQLALPGIAGGALAALEEEAARIVTEDAEKRLNGGLSLHLVGSGGQLSGFIKDAHTTVRFGGGAAAITTHD
jgi:hypothetical protein